jgi:L-histidine Nalpha-methyltransferase
VIHIAIHPSQFPDRVRVDLIESLRRREIKHKFHYESYKQARKWLAVHEAHSPARTDADSQQVYADAFAYVTRHLQHTSAHVIGLGCGGGQKDLVLLQTLKGAGVESIYTAVDVSLPLVITARERAKAVADSTRGLVCDLEIATDIAEELCEYSATQRIITFFGMMPNSEPEVIIPRLVALRDERDYLLVSANLAPGPNYPEGVRRVLPQYDNAETVDWLTVFLTDLGVKPSDGRVHFSIEECADGLLRIRADFQFKSAQTLEFETEKFKFKGGESIRLFFSYRYTPERLGEVFGKAGLRISQQWISASGEEGVFLIS